MPGPKPTPNASPRVAQLNIKSLSLLPQEEAAKVKEKAGFDAPAAMAEAAAVAAAAIKPGKERWTIKTGTDKDAPRVGTEPVGGRAAWMIDAEPRPGYQPQSKEGKFLPKFHGRVWIDTSDLQLAKIDVECLDTVSWGLFLARFHKGSRLTLEQTRVNDEVWLPVRVAVKVDVRLAVLKDFNADIEQTYRDYKKFRGSSKIVGVGELPEPQ